MSVARLLHELRPLFRILDEPLTRGATVYHRSLFDPFLASPTLGHPALDLTEEGDNYVVEAELPGVKKENIDISVGDGGRSVTIQGRTSSRRTGDSPEDASTPAVVTTERLYSGTSSFTRTVWLPHPVDSSKITAKLAEGVLTLKAPKLEDRESIKISID